MPPSSVLSPPMEVLSLMPEFLAKASPKQDCTNPRMAVLPGRPGRLPSKWILTGWQQMEAMSWKADCLTRFIQRILAKAGTLMRHRGNVLAVAASLLLPLEAARYSPATQLGCSFPPTAVRLGSLSMKDSRNARSLMLKLRAPTVFICLPLPAGKVSGENFLVKVPHPHPQ